MTEEAKSRKKAYDLERYDAEREARKEYQREYYRANREAILQRRRMTGFLKYGTVKYERRKNNRIDAET